MSILQRQIRHPGGVVKALICTASSTDPDGVRRFSTPASSLTGVANELVIGQFARWSEAQD